MLIIRSQKGHKFTAGNMIDITMETFTSVILKSIINGNLLLITNIFFQIINGAFSFYTLLITMHH